MNIIKISKLLSKLLRHNPAMFNLKLTNQGYINVDELLSKLNEKGYNISFDDLEYLVETNDKKRFSFNEDKSLIRASQGHTVNVNLELTSKEPPDRLYHGTPSKNLENIFKNGLLKMRRNHVHLSNDIETAHIVAKRYKQEYKVLYIQAKRMFKLGHKFYLSDNGVWLIDNVPPQYINICSI